ncbi:MAG: hypothetical protein RR216_06195 [Pseudoflavonifractor sp.]
MYRIAIIDQDPEAREETHRLAAAFFEQRGESAAFVIGADTAELPAYYDCYLMGAAERVLVLRTPEETPPWASVKKPLELSEFAAIMAAWRILPPQGEGPPDCESRGENM